MSKFTRLLILRACSLGILLTLVMKVFVKSSPYEFPKNLAWHKWESTKTFNNNYYHTKIQGRGYTTEESDNSLKVEVYYIPNNLTGNKHIIKEYQKSESLPENIKVVKSEPIGYYGLFTENNQTYLNTCIHPEGKTAFTHPQFANLATQNLKTRLLPWILGISDLRDWRCFWVNMSLSLDSLTEEEAQDILQEQLKNLVSQITQDI